MVEESSSAATPGHGHACAGPGLGEPCGDHCTGTAQTCVTESLRAQTCCANVAVHLSSSMASILISIKPKYADRILDGRKTVEFRKRTARIEPGTRVLIYSTAPCCAVVGEARISFREQLRLEELWQRYGKNAAIELSEFNAYYTDAEEGVAFGIEDVRRYPEPVPLNALRDADDGFRPPQSYMKMPLFVERLIARLVPLSVSID
jgi:predicted transcriptional regulator